MDYPSGETYNIATGYTNASTNCFVFQKYIPGRV